MIYNTKAEKGVEPHRWKVSKFADVGTNEIFQARFMALADLFNATTTWNSEKKQQITDRFWTMVLEGFTPAFLHLRTAVAMSSDPDAPILNRRAEFDSFYSKLWTAYEHRFGDLAQEMGYKIRFLFSEDEEKYKKRSEQFSKQYGIGMDVLTFLGEQRTSWQNKLADIRNKVVQHPQLSSDAVAEIYTPTVAITYFNNCLQTAEYFTAILLAKHLPESLELADLPPALTENGRRVFAIQFKPGTPFSK